jgi:hypothetical protein
MEVKTEAPAMKEEMKQETQNIKGKVEMKTEEPNIKVEVKDKATSLPRGHLPSM